MTKFCTERHGCKWLKVAITSMKSHMGCGFVMVSWTVAENKYLLFSVTFSCFWICDWWQCVIISLSLFLELPVNSHEERHFQQRSARSMVRLTCQSNPLPTLERDVSRNRFIPRPWCTVMFVTCKHCNNDGRISVCCSWVVTAFKCIAQWNSSVSHKTPLHNLTKLKTPTYGEEHNLYSFTLKKRPSVIANIMELSKNIAWHIWLIVNLNNNILQSKCEGNWSFKTLAQVLIKQKT